MGRFLTGNGLYWPTGQHTKRTIIERTSEKNKTAEIPAAQSHDSGSDGHGPPVGPPSKPDRRTDRHFQTDGPDGGDRETDRAFD